SELVKVMLSIGNSLANSVWEVHIRGKGKPNPSSSREEKEKWIRSKYEHHEYLPGPPLSNVPLGQQLLEAVCKGDLRGVILLLAHAKPEQVNSTVSGRDRRTPLHLSCALGNVVITQLLIWYGANVAAVDQEGRNPLIYARNSGSSECVTILVNNGCPDAAVAGGGTLPRRKGSVTRNSGDVFDKLPASVI
ncbi:PREDICTED: arf-GAP with GTPase, ANK repeat and PH domain-containing protein 11-like, partial [Priapulus caudatus]|uniref:Arf-GAP with GTPase, ANK repeat and PH domain-containing protein 11-like n=1 Tax=Priapulus caudatus TaxID=37621 RepID=A0ABM1F0V8_PRICU